MYLNKVCEIVVTGNEDEYHEACSCEVNTDVGGKSIRIKDLVRGAGVGTRREIHRRFPGKKGEERLIK